MNDNFSLAHLLIFIYRINDINFHRTLFRHLSIHINIYLFLLRYNILTFLPISLLTQFSRVANFYFLIVGILSCFPAISSLSPLSAFVLKFKRYI
jgi:hypothetical protein